jgi:hypothetical protein
VKALHEFAVRSIEIDLAEVEGVDDPHQALEALGVDIGGESIVTVVCEGEGFLEV